MIVFSNKITFLFWAFIVSIVSYASDVCPMAVPVEPKRTYDFYQVEGRWADVSQYNRQQGARAFLSAYFDGLWSDYFFGVETGLALCNDVESVINYYQTDRFYIRNPHMLRLMIERLLQLPVEQDSYKYRLQIVFDLYFVYITRLTYDAMIIRKVSPELYSTYCIPSRYQDLQQSLVAKIRAFITQDTQLEGLDGLIEGTQARMSEYVMFYSARWLLSFVVESRIEAGLPYRLLTLKNETHALYTTWSHALSEAKLSMEAEDFMRNIIEAIFIGVRQRDAEHDLEWLFNANLLETTQELMGMEPLQLHDTAAIDDDIQGGCCCIRLLRWCGCV